MAHWAMPTPCVGDRVVCIARCVQAWGNDVYIVTSLPGCWESDGLFNLRSESDSRCIKAYQREFDYAPTASGDTDLASGGADLAASVVDNDYGNPTGTPLETHGKGVFSVFGTFHFEILRIFVLNLFIFCYFLIRNIQLFILCHPSSCPDPLCRPLLGLPRINPKHQLRRRRLQNQKSRHHH